MNIMKNIHVVLIFLSLLLFFLYINGFSTNNFKIVNLPINQNDLINSFYQNLSSRELKIYSQNREDGVIEAIFELLDLKDLNKYFVEFSPADGKECNTRYLREKKQWNGTMFDGYYYNKDINLYNETIHQNTILNIFEKYKINSEIDFLSEDTDYADYWIVEKVLTKYRPKVIIHEVNQQTPDKCVTVQKSDQLIFWDSSEYHGGSVCAFYCLAKLNEYSMVYCETSGVNCFWIRNDLIEKRLKLDVKILQSILSPQFLYKKPDFVYEKTDKPWHEIKC